MSRDRFYILRRFLHFENNLDATDDQKKDKLWKLRPWLSHLASAFSSVALEENLAVDEVIIPFKGSTSPIAQYIKGKNKFDKNLIIQTNILLTS